MTSRSRKWVAAGMVGTLAITFALASAVSAAGARPAEKNHVLLISVDGLHQSDLAEFIQDNPHSNLAELANVATQYTHASTTKPSDSFPGLLSEVTGGTSKSTGVFYDDSYARNLLAPPAISPNPIPAGKTTCDVNTPGTETQYAENVDTHAGTLTRVILNPDGTTEGIDPNQLPWQKNSDGSCTPVMPNDFLRTNTVFSVADHAGKKTAWSDKHPAYQLVNGHRTPGAVDDLFTPDINADITPPSLTDTRRNTITFHFPNPTANPNGPILTDYVNSTESYDQIKVDAILNEIDGKTSTGKPAGAAPAIFGMNFQSVSVGQKTVDPTLTCDPARSVDVTTCDPNYIPGGYFSTDGGETFKFTPQLEGQTVYPDGFKVPGALNYVDAAIGSMVSELKAKDLYRSTEIIITAKHGQSPIDPSQLAKIGHAETKVLTDAGIGVAQLTDDDVALVWLKDQSQTAAAIAALKASVANGNPARIAHVLSGDQLADLYNNPKNDPHTPDIIIQPIPGTIYSGSSAKVAEHGGFSANDTHVALLVVNSGRDHSGVVDAQVQTTQIAPTILAALGLKPRALDAVRQEGTQVLPGLDD